MNPFSAALAEGGGEGEEEEGEEVGWWIRIKWMMRMEEEEEEREGANLRRVLMPVSGEEGGGEREASIWLLLPLPPLLLLPRPSWNRVSHMCYTGTVDAVRSIPSITPRALQRTFGVRERRFSEAAQFSKDFPVCQHLLKLWFIKKTYVKLMN